MTLFARNILMCFIQGKARAIVFECILIPRLVTGCTVVGGFREMERRTVTTFTRELAMIRLERPACAVMRERFGFTLQVTLVTTHLRVALVTDAVQSLFGMAYFGRGVLLFGMA